MIALADMKAGLAYLDTLAVAVHGDNPRAILRVVTAASEFYATLRPEHPGELDAIGYAIDAIAAAEYRALCLIALDDLGPG